MPISEPNMIHHICMHLFPLLFCLSSFLSFVVCPPCFFPLLSSFFLCVDVDRSSFPFEPPPNKERRGGAQTTKNKERQQTARTSKYLVTGAGSAYIHACVACGAVVCVVSGRVASLRCRLSAPPRRHHPTATGDQHKTPNNKQNQATSNERSRLHSQRGRECGRQVE